MISINIICIGKIKEKYLKDAIEEYSKRLSKYCKLNILELQDEKVPVPLNESIAKQIKQKECKLIESYIPEKSYKIALDLNGNQLSSEEFSKKIDEVSLSNSKITLIIGGTLGFDENFLEKMDYIICFSKMTFPHQLIRVFLLEQLFRSFKISNNETYHH